MASNCLCVRELLNILAANGEQGESGSGWCTGSCAPPTCLVYLIPRCPGHVWGRFCSRPTLPTPPRPRFGPFLFPALLSGLAPATFRAVFVPGPAFRPRPSHVWGRFCSRPTLPTPPRPRFGPFLFPALPSDPLQRPLLQCQSICVRDAHEHLDFREEAIHHFFVHFEDASDLGVAGMVVIVQQFG